MEFNFYTGDFKGDKMNGLGTLYYVNNDQYIGKSKIFN